MLYDPTALPVMRIFTMPVSPRLRLFSCALTSTLLLAGGMTNATASDAMSQHVQVRGTIVSLMGDRLNVQSREGKPVTVELKKGWMVSGIANAKSGDIKKGDYVGIASLPGNGGRDGALEVLIFPAQLRGANEGNFSWDLKPGSSMTNATVANTVKSVNNSVVTVSYHGHEKKINIAQGTPVVTLAPATQADIKPGATVFVPAEKGERDALVANTFIVGINGVVPPM